MGFQIKDKEGNAIGMKALDAEVAAFWGKECDPKWYATPHKVTPEMDECEAAFVNTTGNWFDTIGWNIHNPQSNWTSGWDNVKNSIWLICANGRYKEIFEDLGVIYSIRVYMEPYFALIDHWAAKGYTPHKVEDC